MGEDGQPAGAAAALPEMLAESGEGEQVNFISLFSGCGGADIGAMLAGYTPICANEYDPAIAAVYARNLGNHIRVGDILEQDPRDYPACDLLHASPPCPNFSVAKVGAAETPHDIALAEKVAEFIRVLSPRAVTIENVGAYRKSKSYQIILKAITQGGYMYDAQILCAADYGVPQTRRRFIVRAVKGLLRPMPEPVPWIGCYAAIEDLLDTLPDSQFAEWQLKRLPDELKTYLVGGQNMNGGMDCDANYPAQTVTTNHPPRAFIPSNAATEYGDGQREQDEPAHSITGQANGRTRAFVTNLQNSSREFTALNGNEPYMTVTSSDFKRASTTPRASLANGRVVAMTPRALARFQSFPDWYQLPENKALACKIIGNAAPPLMMRAVFESLKG